MTIEELQRRLRQLHARLGFEGRIAVTVNQEGQAAGDGRIGFAQSHFYVTHWFRPDGSAFEDCKAVGQGTLEECLTALDRYADQYRRRPTREEVGQTIGILPRSVPERFKLAAE